tara:strand:- start:601 stop:825 length:225 start_codon:yes stop_codon:yes gene_type:complete
MDNNELIKNIIEAIKINVEAYEKNEKLIFKWLNEYKKSKNIRTDLEFQKRVLEEAIEALKYKDRFPNEAKNREG